MTSPDLPRHDTYPGLDGLRFLGALAVLVTHVAFQTGAYAGTLAGTALSRLDVGVAIFFVLSGFLLSRPWLLAAEHATPRPRTGRYWWHRAVRILPAYLVTVVVALLVLEENAGASLRTWVANLGLVALYTEDRLPPGLTQMWSLATEVAFYAALPLVMLAALGRRPQRVPAGRLLVVLTGLCALNLAWNAGGSRLVGTSTSLLQWLPGYLTWFSAGIALAAVTVVLRRAEPPGWARTVADVGSAPWTCWGLAAAVFVVASTPLAGPYDFTQIASDASVVTKNLLYVVVGVLVVLPGVFAPAGSTFLRLTTRPLLRHLGRTSYALFCCHLVVLDLVQQWLDLPVFGGRTVLVLALTLAGSLLVSEVLYRLVEVPATRLRSLRPSDLVRSRRGGSSTSSPAQTSETTTAS